MKSTIISSRVIVGNWYKELNSTDTRRVVKMETVKHIEYDMPGRKGSVIHYSYNTLDTISWYQNECSPVDYIGAIQFGSSSQGIGDTLPEWAM
jgi:hypothetical protein